MQRILLFVLLSLLPLNAVADGKVYSRPIALAAEVNIPDQRALIRYTNGVERLVIETRFTGEGTNFAWVVPLPNQPVIEAATTGLFPTLQYLFKPTIIHHVRNYYGWILFVISVLLVLRWMVERLGSTVVFTSVFVVLFLLVMAVLLLPALAKSKAGGTSESPDTSVSILDRQMVGVFETTTIASRDPRALQSWLRENGFVVTTNSEAVIESYVKDGWVFVAAKVLRNQSERQTSTPHPLSFTFKTDKPVYPMRLTGVDNGPLQVELYVFGERRAFAPHFKVTRCTQPNYPTLAGWPAYWSPDRVNVTHPRLLEWVGGASVATKMTATLSPEQMRQDVWLEWRDFAEKKDRFYSRTGALTIALNWGVSILAAGLILAYAVAVTRRPYNPQFAKPMRLAVVVGLAISGLVYLALPTIEVRLVRRSFSETRNAQWYPLSLVEDENLAEARKILANPLNYVTNSEQRATWTGHFKAGNWPNHYLGGQIHEEDSPGNFILREVNGNVEYVIYDSWGEAQVLQSWKPENVK
jgi:Uncharacterized protein conserved in bacteria (DUF2330)